MIRITESKDRGCNACGTRDVVTFEVRVSTDGCYSTVLRFCTTCLLNLVEQASSTLVAWVTKEAKE